ncbi:MULTISPECIES: hypothetical protein [Burkholderia]|jgi:hypothetical protein|uniref:Uncharacterized protein n=2 Tax=Burkholderia contaminans TaxID=488447 RepID=A0A1E3FLZ5_9BURK|nr:MULTISPECIES: hypothetical protein [Burkholderia]UTP24609.1 hypothetical protein NMB33_29530 [Burkholderia sp. FXe9]KKL32181.1 hypothetical protein WR31_31285 [Burkholderia contaminans LMG 23361]MBA9833930.1 hypothetical protein [Burkholderia contaminans]MBA9840623.1 hypothetical protein [Burkholderia contaminans]MBA9865661.1 hypothetical protein [Burkholderia contaminans]
MDLMEAVPVARPESRRARTVSLPSGQQLARQLVTTVRVAEVLLHQAIVVPARHQWSVDTERVDAAGGPLAAWETCVTWRIGKVFASTVTPAARVNDRDQVAVEIRLYLPEQDYVAGRHVNTFGLRHGNAFCATLSVASGAQWSWQRKEHVAPEHRHVRGDTLEALVDTVAANVNAALGAAGFGPKR